MKNNLIKSKICVFSILCIFVFYETIKAVEEDKKNISIVYIECQHLINKVEWILAKNKDEQFSLEEREFFVNYVGISFDSLKNLINSNHSDKTVFRGIDSERARTDAKMLMNQRLNAASEELFQLPLIPDADTEFIKRLNAVKLAITKVSDVLPH